VVGRGGEHGVCTTRFDVQHLEVAHAEIIPALEALDAETDA